MRVPENWTIHRASRPVLYIIAVDCLILGGFSALFRSWYLVALLTLCAGAAYVRGRATPLQRYPEDRVATCEEMTTIPGYGLLSFLTLAVVVVLAFGSVLAFWALMRSCVDR